MESVVGTSLLRIATDKITAVNRIVHQFENYLNFFTVNQSLRSQPLRLARGVI